MTTASGQRTDGDALAAGAEGLASRRGETRGRGCLRFAFYGRVSTEDRQDPATSRARQLQQAMMQISQSAYSEQQEQADAYRKSSKDLDTRVELSGQSAKFFARGCDLFVQPLRFDFSFRVGCRGALAFALQPFGLLS